MRVQCLLELTVINTRFDSDGTALGVEFENAIQVSRENEHDTAAQRRSGLVSTGAPRRDRDNTAAFRQLPGETSRFADIVLVARIDDEGGSQDEYTGVGRKIASRVGRCHYFPD